MNQAVDDHAWLLSRGYSVKATLALVGNRYRLSARQRQAVYRASCSDQSRDFRQEKEWRSTPLGSDPLIIDGYNLLITIEAALSGGIILLCRDGCIRDIASIHGTYRRVEETRPALHHIGRVLIQLGQPQAHWLLDRPVSNSGRLRELMLSVAQEHGFDWQVELVNSPDKTIVNAADYVAISSDGWVLDHVSRWFNLARVIIDQLPETQVMALQGT